MQKKAVNVLLKIKVLAYKKNKTIKKNKIKLSFKHVNQNPFQSVLIEKFMCCSLTNILFSDKNNKIAC